MQVGYSEFANLQTRVPSFLASNSLRTRVNFLQTRQLRTCFFQCYLFSLLMKRFTDEPPLLT